jgi:hypothetical protein
MQLLHSICHDVSWMMQRLSVLYFKSPSLVCILHGHGGRGIDDDSLVKLSGLKIECLRSWV